MWGGADWGRIPWGDLLEAAGGVPSVPPGQLPDWVGRDPGTVWRGGDPGRIWQGLDAGSLLRGADPGTVWHGADPGCLWRGLAPE